MARLGILFAGQGAQRTGMGLSFVQADETARLRLADASRILGYDLGAVLSSADGRLDETLHAQPAIVVASVLAYRALLRQSTIRPAAFAGFSLGEWSALGAAGVFDFEHLLRLVKVRAEAMAQAAAAIPGGMAAVLGLDGDIVAEICRQASNDREKVDPANYNCPGQIVISGHLPALERASILAREQGAKRVIPLNVSGAFHTPLMRSASERMAEALRTADFFPAFAPVYANVTAEPYGPGEWKRLLAAQIVSPVQFEATIRAMISAGITHFLEIGPGTALSGFVRKIAPLHPVLHLGEAEEIDIVKGWIKDHGLDQ